METDLKFRPFRSPADPGWDEAWAIYQNSFPQKEIRSLEDHLQALSDPHYTADGIWSDGRLIGILYYWTAPEYVYIEHLAISPDLRGANMGSRVLEAFCRKAGRIVLEIDPPETEIAVRRLRFYERLGFVRNDYHYVHPSFQRPYEPHQLVLMSYPKAMTDDAVLQQFFRSLLAPDRKRIAEGQGEENAREERDDGRTEERTYEQSGKKDLAPVELCGLHGFRELQRFHTVLITFCKRCCKYTGFIPLKQRGKSYVV